MMRASCAIRISHALYRMIECVCVYMYICCFLYVFMHVCIYIYIYIYLYLYLFIYIFIGKRQGTFASRPSLAVQHSQSAGQTSRQADAYFHLGVQEVPGFKLIGLPLMLTKLHRSHVDDAVLQLLVGDFAYIYIYTDRRHQIFQALHERSRTSR